jgi:hypothetical protein
MDVAKAILSLLKQRTLTGTIVEVRKKTDSKKVFENLS